MADISEMFKQLVTMGAQFESVANQVNRIEERQIQLLQRLSTLEEKTSTINESARSAAAAGISELRAQFAERLVRLEMAAELPSASNPNRLGDGAERQNSDH